MNSPISRPLTERDVAEIAAAFANAGLTLIAFCRSQSVAATGTPPIDLDPPRPANGASAPLALPPPAPPEAALERGGGRR